MQGLKYFKPLSRTIMDFVNTPEGKYDNGITRMKRKHITATDIIYIGKEANNIEEEVLEVEKPQRFVNYKKLNEEILKLTIKEADLEHRSTLNRIKDKIKNGQEINYNTPAMRKILRYLSKIDF